MESSWEIEFGARRQRLGAPRDSHEGERRIRCDPATARLALFAAQRKVLSAVGQRLRRSEQDPPWLAIGDAARR
jgi:hypothetical protein